MKVWDKWSSQECVDKEFAFHLRYFHYSCYHPLEQMLKGFQESMINAIIEQKYRIFKTKSICTFKLCSHGQLKQIGALAPYSFGKPPSFLIRFDW